MTALLVFAALILAALLVWSHARRLEIARQRDVLSGRVAELEDALREARRALERRKREQPSVERRHRIEALSPLLALEDHVQRAASHVDEATDVAGVREGIDLLARDLDALWRRAGVRRIDAEPGTPFDPRFHEAVARVESEDVDTPSIQETVEHGYILAASEDRDDEASVVQDVLRVARVVVAMPAAASEPNETDDGDEQ